MLGFGKSFRDGNELFSAENGGNVNIVFASGIIY